MVSQLEGKFTTIGRAGILHPLPDMQLGIMGTSHDLIKINSLQLDFDHLYFYMLYLNKLYMR